MKTAAYTICYNEIKKLDQWLYYTKDFDYRVILDTGSCLLYTSDAADE